VVYLGLGAIDAFPLGSATLLEVWTVAPAVGDPVQASGSAPGRVSGVRDDDDDDDGRKGFLRLG
jgi:hypothetical protein